MIFGDAFYEECEIRKPNRANGWALMKFMLDGPNSMSQILF
jgi:hypothetical protein